MPQIPVPPYYKARTTGEPFILPFIPVILTKMDNETGKELCVLFSARVETLIIKEVNFFKEKFTIDYFILSDTNDANKSLTRRGHRGYSIVVTQCEYENSLRLNNSDEIGLDFIIDPKGQGIGSIILNHLFYWAKANHPHYQAPYIKLSIVDEWPDNIERRNALYGNIGLLNKNALKVGDLTPEISSKGFKIRKFQEYEDDIHYLKERPYSNFDLYRGISNSNLIHNQKPKTFPELESCAPIKSQGLFYILKHLWRS